MTDIAELMQRITDWLGGLGEIDEAGTLVAGCREALEAQARRIAELETTVRGLRDELDMAEVSALAAHPAGFTKAKERAVEACIDLAAKWEKVDPALARGAGPKEGCIDCADAIRAMEPE